jgi:uncharacterized protein (DUF305 family)
VNIGTIAGAGLLAGTLLLAACSGEDTSTVTGSQASPPAASAQAQQADVNDADIAFVRGMRPHHEQAVEMADIILDKSPRPEIRTLAEQVRDEQQPEIEQLDRMLDHFGVEADSDGGYRGHGGGSDMPMHGGMMSQEQMAALHRAEGVEAERMFVESMIEHHRGAVEAADAQLAEGVHRPAREMAESIRASQQAEIQEMQRLLSSL